MKRPYRILLPLLLPILLASACADSPTRPAVHQPGAPSGRITGIRVTDAESPEQRMEWGHASWPNVDMRGGGSGNVQMPPGGFLVANPFPNPTVDATYLSVALVEPGRVQAWVERVETTIDAGRLFGGDDAFVPSRTVIGRFVDANLQAGEHTFAWSRRHMNLPAGFYRIFVMTEHDLAWRDVLVYDRLEDLPIELRNVVDDL